MAWLIPSHRMADARQPSHGCWGAPGLYKGQAVRSTNHRMADPQPSHGRCPTIARLIPVSRSSPGPAPKRVRHCGVYTRQPSRGGCSDRQSTTAGRGPRAASRGPGPSAAAGRGLRRLQRFGRYRAGAAGARGPVLARRPPCLRPGGGISPPQIHPPPPRGGGGDRAGTRTRRASRSESTLSESLPIAPGHRDVRVALHDPSRLYPSRFHVRRGPGLAWVTPMSRSSSA